MFGNKKKIKKLEIQLNYTEKEFERTNNELQTYKRLYKEQLEKSNYSDYLIKQNEKLIEWIEKIINEVGIYTVNEDMKSFKIPVCNISGPLYDTDFNGEMFNVERKEIHLPAIDISKCEYK